MKNPIHTSISDCGMVDNYENARKCVRGLLEHTHSEQGEIVLEWEKNLKEKEDCMGYISVNDKGDRWVEFIITRNERWSVVTYTTLDLPMFDEDVKEMFVLMNDGLPVAVYEYLYVLENRLKDIQDLKYTIKTVRVVC